MLHEVSRLLVHRQDAAWRVAAWHHRNTTTKAKLRAAACALGGATCIEYANACPVHAVHLVPSDEQFFVDRGTRTTCPSSLFFSRQINVAVEQTILPSHALRTLLRAQNPLMHASVWSWKGPLQTNQKISAKCSKKKCHLPRDANFYFPHLQFADNLSAYASKIRSFETTLNCSLEFSCFFATNGASTIAPT